MAGKLNCRAGARICVLSVLVFGMVSGAHPSALGAESPQPRPWMVQTFLEIELLNPACWRYVTAFGIVEYENICSADSKVALVKGDGKAATYAIPPHGKLVFIGGNTVHIFGKPKGTGQ